MSLIGKITESGYYEIIVDKTQTTGMSKLNTLKLKAKDRDDMLLVPFNDEPVYLELAKQGSIFSFIASALYVEYYKLDEELRELMYN